jgi:cytochrome c-type biogenesis protein CcmH/NrfF
MSELFTKESVKEKHRMKIREIMKGGGDVEEIVDYIISRISTVISYERRKNERRQLREWSEDYENKKGSSSGQQ